MSYEQKEGQGSLFKNDKRATDKHPNATGSALIGGVEYWVSCWVKEGKSGKWQSLSFTPKDKQAARTPEKQPAKSSEDIPF